MSSEQKVTSPTIIWEVEKPKVKKGRDLVRLTEEAAKFGAIAVNRQIAIIRSIPHKTTRQDGKWIKWQNHVTAHFKHSKAAPEGTGFQGHVYVDEGNKRVVEAHEVWVAKQNPEVWEL